MARHVWSVLCYKSSIDKDDNQISLLAVTEKLTIRDPSRQDLEQLLEETLAEDKGIIFPVNLHLVTWWVRSDYEKPETRPLRLQVLFPDGKRIVAGEGVIDLTKAAGHRVRWALNTLLFRGFGLHWFSIESKPGKRWSVAARIPLEIVHSSDGLSSEKPS